MKRMGIKRVPYFSSGLVYIRNLIVFFLEVS